MSPPQVLSPIEICLILKAVPLFRTLLLWCYSFCWQLCVLCLLSRKCVIRTMFVVLVTGQKQSLLMLLSTLASPEPDSPLHHIKYSISESSSDSTNSYVLAHDVVPLPSISRLPGAYLGIGYYSCVSDGAAESVDNGKHSELVITRKNDIKLYPLLPNCFVDEDVHVDCLSGRIK